MQWGSVGTRWGSVGDIEIILKKGHPYFGPVFTALFAEKASVKKRSRPITSVDGAFDYAEDKRGKIKQAIKAVNSTLLNIMVFAYSVVHGPAKRLQTWIQKQDGDFNKKAKGCGDHAYLGPTTMSQFVAFKNKELRDDIIYRLSDAAEADGTLWLGLWPKVPVDRVGETRALIVTLVVSLLCQWDMRIGDSMSTFPLLLLLCVEQPPDVDDQRRRSIAAELQSTPDEKLIGLFDDIAIKMKSRYQAQFQVMNDTGCCPRDLYLALLLFRWALVSNTQRVEGSNSTLQSICKAAPAIHLPLASDRLPLKLGPALTWRCGCASQNQRLGTVLQR